MKHPGDPRFTSTISTSSPLPFSPTRSKNNGFQVFPCKTSPFTSASDYSVFFTRDNIDDLTIKIHKQLVDSRRANAAIFVQNRLVKPDRIVLHRSGDSLTIECPHPNRALRPNLFKGLENLTPKLNGGRIYIFELEKNYIDGNENDNNNNGTDDADVGKNTNDKDIGAVLSSSAGNYDCSWTPAPDPGSAAAPPTPRTSFEVNFYASQTVCQVENDDGNVVKSSGVDGRLEVGVTNGSAVEDVVVSCSLPWSGSDDQLGLQWKDLDADRFYVSTLNDNRLEFHNSE